MTQSDEGREDILQMPICTPCGLGVHSCCTTRTHPCRCGSAWHLAWGQVPRRVEAGITHQLSSGGATTR